MISLIKNIILELDVRTNNVALLSFKIGYLGVLESVFFYGIRSGKLETLGSKLLEEHVKELAASRYRDLNFLEELLDSSFRMSINETFGYTYLGVNKIYYNTLNLLISSKHPLFKEIILSKKYPEALPETLVEKLQKSISSNKMTKVIPVSQKVRDYISRLMARL